MPAMFQVDAFLSVTIAVMFVITGKMLAMNVPALRRCAFPQPVAGGLGVPLVRAFLIPLVNAVILLLMSGS